MRREKSRHLRNSMLKTLICCPRVRRRKTHTVSLPPSLPPSLPLFVSYLFLARLGMSSEDSLHLRKSILKTLICCPRVRRKDMGTPVTRAISM